MEGLNLVHYSDPEVPGLPSYSASETVWDMPESWRRDYVNIKYSIAKCLQPQRICEIGVYSGIAALSFLAACPHAEYVGIDNLYSERARNSIGLVDETRRTLVELGYKVLIYNLDSQMLPNLPKEPFDLIHVDAAHTRTAKAHDVKIAWRALAPKGWLLIDNGHDPSVVAGTFDAMHELLQGTLFKWHYLEDSVGNILIEKELP